MQTDLVLSTPLNEIQTCFNKLKLASDKFIDVEVRISNLKKLKKVILQNESEIISAVQKDLNKPHHECWPSEIGTVLEELDLTISELPQWSQPQLKDHTLLLLPAEVIQKYDPLGVVLIIAPWNYPFQLIMNPLIGAIAAGNRAIIKPSELTAHTSLIVQKIIQETFQSDQVATVLGGVSETTELLKLSFDMIFFTGSTSVGKIIMQAAAKNLTPVVLELGGKSPVIISENANLDLAARRITWGKTFNAGQTCVAPDYVLIHEKVYDIFLEKLKHQFKTQWPYNEVTKKTFTKIVNKIHFQRLENLLTNTKIIYQSPRDTEDLFFSPTIVEVNANEINQTPCMQEEIFGPILPVIKYSNYNEAHKIIKSFPKPLTAYLFSCNSNEQEIFNSEIQTGGICINDVVIQFSNPHVGFGGVGASGMGAYHGKESFVCFSHLKTITKKSKFLDLSARYAPYTPFKSRLIRILMGRWR
jgi:aldehyde dehydrogenase (NAD+)